MTLIGDEEIETWLIATNLFEKLLKNLLNDDMKKMLKQVAQAQLTADRLTRDKRAEELEAQVKNIEDVIKQVFQDQVSMYVQGKKMAFLEKYQCTELYREGDNLVVVKAILNTLAPKEKGQEDG